MLSIIFISKERRCLLGGIAGRFLLGGGFPRGTLLSMQSLADFFGVAFVVEFQQALQDFAAGGFADGEAEALLTIVEAVTQ